MDEKILSAWEQWTIFTKYTKVSNRLYGILANIGKEQCNDKCNLYFSINRKGNLKNTQSGIPAPFTSSTLDNSLTDCTLLLWCRRL